MVQIVRFYIYTHADEFQRVLIVFIKINISLSKFA